MTAISTESSVGAELGGHLAARRRVRDAIFEQVDEQLAEQVFVSHKRHVLFAERAHLDASLRPPAREPRARTRQRAPRGRWRSARCGRACASARASRNMSSTIRVRRSACSATIVSDSRYSCSVRCSRPSVTCAVVRVTDTGVRSSCEASAMNWRCADIAASSRSSSPLKACPSCASSSRASRHRHPLVGRQRRHRAGLLRHRDQRPKRLAPDDPSANTGEQQGQRQPDASVSISALRSAASALSGAAMRIVYVWPAWRTGHGDASERLRADVGTVKKRDGAGTDARNAASGPVFDCWRAVFPSERQDDDGRGL